MDKDKVRRILRKNVTIINDHNYDPQYAIPDKKIPKIVADLEKLFAIPVVSLPKGTFVPCDVKLPKEPRPIGMNTKYRRDKLLGTNES